MTVRNADHAARLQHLRTQSPRPNINVPRWAMRPAVLFRKDAALRLGLYSQTQNRRGIGVPFGEPPCRPRDIEMLYGIVADHPQNSWLWSERRHVRVAEHLRQLPNGYPIGNHKRTVVSPFLHVESDLGSTRRRV